MPLKRGSAVMKSVMTDFAEPVKRAADRDSFNQMTTIPNAS
jgi:hypothetical protein